MTRLVSLIRNIFFIPFKIVNYFLLKISRVNYKRIQINGIIFIINSGKIHFGNDIKINSSKFKNIIGGDTRTSLVVKKGAILNLGNNVRISNTAIYCAERIEIGDNVFIGGSTKIWDTDFHSLDYIQRNATPNDGYKTKPIIIEDNVFIGGFSIILKGARIGKNSIIGAGSVVSKAIPSNEVWAGNPARFIRKIE